MPTEFNARESRIQAPGLQVHASPVATVAMPAKAFGKKGGLFADLADGLAVFNKQFDQLAQVKTQEQAVESTSRAQADQLKAGTVDPRPGFGPSDDVFYQEARFQVFASQQAADLESQFDAQIDALVNGEDKDALLAANPQVLADEFTKKHLEGVTDPTLVKAIVPRILRARDQSVQKVTIAKQKEQARRDRERAYTLMTDTYNKDYTPERMTATMVQLRASGLNDALFVDAAVDFAVGNSMKGNGDPRLVEHLLEADVGNGLSVFQLALKSGNDKAVKAITELKAKVDSHREKALTESQKQAAEMAELKWGENRRDPAYRAGRTYQQVRDEVWADTSLPTPKKNDELDYWAKEYATTAKTNFARDALANGAGHLLTTEQKKPVYEKDIQEVVTAVTATGRATEGSLNMVVKKVVDLQASDGAYKSEFLQNYFGRPSVETYALDANGQMNAYSEAKWQALLKLDDDPVGRVALDKHMPGVEDRTFVTDVKDQVKAGVQLPQAIENVRNVRKSMTPQIIQANQTQTNRLLGSDQLFETGLFEHFWGGDSLDEVSSGSMFVRDEAIPLANQLELRRTASAHFNRLDSKKTFGSDEEKIKDFQKVFQAQYVPVDFGPGEPGTSHYVRVPPGYKTPDTGKYIKQVTNAIRMKAASMNLKSPGTLMLEPVDESAKTYQVVNSSGDPVTGFRTLSLDEILKFGQDVTMRAKAAGSAYAKDKLWGTQWFHRKGGELHAELQEITKLRDTGKFEAAKQAQAARELPPIDVRDLKKRDVPALVRDTVRDNLGSDPSLALTASLEGFTAGLIPDNKGSVIGYGYNVNAQSDRLKEDFRAAGIADMAGVLAGKVQITEPQGRALYKQVEGRNAKAIAAEVNRIGGNWDAMPENRKAALLHLAYNGGSAMHTKRGDTLLRKAVAAVVAHRIDDLKTLNWGFQGGNGVGKPGFNRNTRLTDAVWAMARGVREFEMTLK